MFLFSNLFNLHTHTPMGFCVSCDWPLEEVDGGLGLIGLRPFKMEEDTVVWRLGSLSAPGGPSVSHTHTHTHTRNPFTLNYTFHLAYQSMALCMCMWLGLYCSVTVGLTLVSW